MHLELDCCVPASTSPRRVESGKLPNFQAKNKTDFCHQFLYLCALVSSGFYLGLSCTFVCFCLTWAATLAIFSLGLVLGASGIWEMGQDLNITWQNNQERKNKIDQDTEQKSHKVTNSVWKESPSKLYFNFNKAQKNTLVFEKNARMIRWYKQKEILLQYCKWKIVITKFVRAIRCPF